jgi:adenylyl-sulfate kinase
MSRGFVVWFTGLSGSGKSTLTSMLAAELRARGVHVETLDGDAVRRHLSKGLGFSREDRDANIRRIGFVARLVAQSGGCAIAAAISPYTEIRNEIRRSMERFCEVYTECPISVLADRDPKGLYKKALAGEIKNFTGVDDPYQAPENPDVHLHTDRESPDESVRKILARLEDLGYVPRRDASPGTIAASGGPLLPHGGDLVDRLLRGDQVRDAGARAAEASRIQLSEWDLACVGAVAQGLFSPLKGFTTSKDHPRILDAMRLETGLPWAVPLPLEVPETSAEGIREGTCVGLLGPSGALVALLTVSDVWKGQATGSPPKSPRARLGGELECFEVPPPAFLGPSPSPRDVRRRLDELGAQSVVALPSFSVPTRADEHRLRCALELHDAALVIVGGWPEDEVQATTRAACWRALASRYFPPDRVTVVTYPRPLDDSSNDGRPALHDLIVAQNLGATHVIVPDGSRAPAHAAELSVRRLISAPFGWSGRLGHPASHRTAPDVSTDPSLDDEASSLRPEVSALLAEHRVR